jgi:phage tail-like protein
MATDKGNNQDSNWPLPKFSFEVDFGAPLHKALFTEVSGLDVEAQIIEYRRGNSPVFSTIKMPGIVKHGNITLKKGVLKNDIAFQDWQKQLSMNTVNRAPIIIRLLDEAGKPAMTWTLMNAWPVKITSTELKSGGNDVAVESIELMHEGLQIANA